MSEELNSLRGKKILVTGGGGFIGTNTVKDVYKRQVWAGVGTEL